MYYLKLLSILGTMSLTSVTPILTLATLNNFIEPNACWANDYAGVMPYLCGASVAFGIVVGDKMLRAFLK